MDSNERYRARLVIQELYIFDVSTFAYLVAIIKTENSLGKPYVKQIIKFIYILYLHIAGRR